MTSRSLAFALALSAGAAISLPAVSIAVEKPVASEKNPPGDIPDTQVFVDYQGAGVTMKVPEGWARADEANGAIFSDKYNRVELTTQTTASSPSVSSVTSHEAKDLVAGGRAVKIIAVKEVKLDGGRAVRVDYSANSEPNAVTSKQIRLEEVRFYLRGPSGKLAVLDMSAPNGADNVDQWNLMSNSLRVQ
ncbi:MAG: hypothetical protein BGO82_00805 [Devosia sp. 67-54]|jgi:hypothetical protein|uniref:hypothetical protein n=1 Tax=unclassified Devosia TaxID=196773 RepID=UPI00095C2F2D|nr:MULTISPECIES: hypothetical protein [unclassified Devosia]MBN9305996.1 hypothetical protein [Devosia sp.]OJX16326.1 MAG: hypothetical protein BGO82_00805 [Devosia sp. 67-54]